MHTVHIENMRDGLFGVVNANRILPMLMKKEKIT